MVEQPETKASHIVGGPLLKVQEVGQPFRFLSGSHHTRCTALSRNVDWDDGLDTLVAHALSGF